MPAPARFDCVAKTSVAFMARHAHISGLAVTQDNTSAISVRVIGQGAIGVTLDAAVDKATTVFDALVTDDPRWPDDCNESTEDVGYNFLYVAPLTAFPARGYYTVEFRFTDTSERVTKVVYEGAARSTNEA